ncbi:MAG: DNA translocase FtsK 4TM domain-containing protein [Alysiella sp.]|uniref:DNA translocase FtsK n=1 Tax=Alysiella sp. TaxID=1872483 RepID=UPI0026DAA145|nr:DNA translocase FtsK [Alysiella sp.]MDO4433862.1 DNA translocase FtsK 4TM domain-containing protein [Alysiella sp.]
MSQKKPTKNVSRPTRPQLPHNKNKHTRTIGNLMPQTHATTRKHTSKNENPNEDTQTFLKTTRKAATVFQQTHVPDNSRQLIGDTKWLFGVVGTVYFAISLLGFHMSDPSWSRSIARSENVHNFGGLLGAYLADIVYYLFGFSAWWLLVAMLMMLYRKFRPFAEKGTPDYKPNVAGVGLLMMLICSPVLEFYALGSWLKNSLPLGAGGWIGTSSAAGLAALLGNTLSLVMVFIAALLAFSLMVQISWLDFLESIGVKLETTFHSLFHNQPEPQNRTVLKPTAQTPNQPEHDKDENNPTVKPKSINGNRKINVSTALPMIQSNRHTRPTPPQANDESGYILPDTGCLKMPAEQTVHIDEAQIQQTAHAIETKLAEFGIDVEVVNAASGPVITRYEIQPAKGVKGSQIVNLAKDLARSLSLQSVRVVETIAGKNTMGIELPNVHRQEVLLYDIFHSDLFLDASSKLTVALGKDIAGQVVVGDLAKMPHLLVGGMTGSGKSVGVNAMILSILFKARPDEVRFIMIDPKMLELSVYEGIPHLLAPVVTDMREAGNALNWCVAEMEKRYRLLSKMGVRNLAGFNEKIQAAKDTNKSIPNPFSLNPDEPEPLEKLPQIVVVIDELADLMMTEKKAVETQIARLAQKARAAGIHMIIATQRPSVDVITGLIKANVPTRMAFTVQSRIDSRTILDQMGAEDLLKYGDLLFLQPGHAEPTRLQGAFVGDDEVHQVVSFIKAQAEPNYVEGLLTGEATEQTNRFINPESLSGSQDELFDQAVQFILSSRKASISSLQRHLRIGYNRAANLMQELEEAGIVSPAEIDGKRHILVRLEQ